MLVKRKIGELRVSELRAELERRKLDNKGLKSVLLQRLQKVSQATKILPNTKFMLTILIRPSDFVFGIGHYYVIVPIHPNSKVIKLSIFFKWLHG